MYTNELMLGGNIVSTELKQNRIEELTSYVEENQAKFYRLAYSYCKNKDTAMDIVQESITKAISKIDFLREEKYLKTWFYRILINESITSFKKHKTTDDISLEEYELPFIDNDTSHAIDLYKQITSLKPKLKTVIILRFYEDLKIEDIAKITNTNTNTIKSRLYKALEELKIQIKGEMIE